VRERIACDDAEHEPDDRSRPGFSDPSNRAASHTKIVVASA
jgi:hypothetical protein